MRRSVDLVDQHVSLATAAAFAYREIMAAPLATASTVAAWNATLHAVARTLSRACPIYSTADGKLVRMSMIVLSEGRFDHGGAIFRASDGTVYRQLTVSWRDLDVAVTTLKQVGVRFDAP